LVPWIANSDVPAARLVRRRAKPVNARPSGGNQRRRNPVGAQNGNHLIHCVSFADAPRIETHATHFKPDRTMDRVEFNFPIPDMIERNPYFRAVRQMAAVLIEAPDLHERTDGNIERTRAFPAVL